MRAQPVTLGGDVRYGTELYAIIDTAAETLGGLDILVTVVAARWRSCPQSSFMRWLMRTGTRCMN
jgi:hypothetical protein